MCSFSSADVHETERVFKKVIHPTHGHNSIRLVDKDGIPLRPPNSAALSRLHSSYMLTPRGVPARKSTHSYSGQIAKEKMHNLVSFWLFLDHDIIFFFFFDNIEIIQDKIKLSFEYFCKYYGKWSICSLWSKCSIFHNIFHRHKNRAYEETRFSW